MAGTVGERAGVTEHPRRAEEARIRAAYARRVGAWRYDWSNPAYVFAMQDLQRRVLATLCRSGLWPLRGKRVLDVGCGTGHWLRLLIGWGAEPRRVVGVDLLRDRLAHATELAPRRMVLSCGNAATLAFRNASFDLVLQFTVFTSILDPDLRRCVADEMVRVLKPDGTILWYDFCVDNPHNPDVRAVKAAEIARLFPACAVHLRRVTLAPPLTRWLAPRSWTLCALLNAVHPLRTHDLGVIKRR